MPPMSPLAEGRELKSGWRLALLLAAGSPLAEGRELKWNGKRWTRRPLRRPSRRGVN